MKPVELEIIMRDSTRQGMQSVEQGAQKMGKTVEQVTADFKARMQEQSDVVKQVEADIKSLEKQLSKAAPGKAKMELTADLTAAKQVLAEEKGGLEALGKQVADSAQKHVMLRTQIAHAKQEMAGMTEGTEEYRAAMARLGQMQDQYGDIATQGRIFADDNKNIKATMDAVSGLSGAMTAGVGVASLFGMEEEKLAQIQTKLQAVMAITMGVQQVANTLNKDSYFTHVLLAKGKVMLTAANTKLAVSLGISTAAAQVLMATLTLGVSVAIAAIIYAYTRWNAASREAEREQQRLTTEIERTKSAINQISADVDFDVRIAEAAGASKAELLSLRKEAAKTALSLADLNFDNVNNKFMSGKAKKEQLDEARNVAQEAWDNYNKVMQDAVVYDTEKRNKKKKPKGDSKESLTAKADDAELKARQKIDDMYLSLMAEGAEKERAQAAHDFELEKARIKKEETERLALYESLKKAGVKIDPNQPQIIRRQAESQNVLAGADYDNKIDGINEKETQGKRDNLEKLLKPYRDFAQQRIVIEKQYDADIEQLQKEKDNAKGDAGKEQLINDSMVVAEEEKANALAELDRVFAEKDVYFQTLMSRLGAMSLEELQKALTNAEKALQNNQLSGGKNSKETVVARAKVAALKSEIKVAEAENEMKAPDDLAKWKKTSASIKKCKGEIDDMIDSMDFLDESTKAALQAASNIAGGAIAMIDGIKTLSVSAADGIKTVEDASVILAIVGAAIQILTAIFSMASASEEKHQKALKEIADNKLAMQREYNLLLLQQNLLMKEATTIFGEKEIAKAANAVEVYRDAIKQYKEELKGEAPTFKLTSLNINDSLADYKKQKAAYEKGIGALNNVEVKTGHKKTGLFGWGKGKDIYSSVLSVYPDLIDAENKLNVERAKTIISTQTMSDENKNLLQNLIDLQEQAEEAQEALRDYLQDTFGGLGDGIMDSITEAIQSGNDAWESFGDKGAEVLENLGKQIMYSLFFADKFAKLQKDLEGIYGSGKSETDIAKDAMDLVGDFYANIGKDMDAAQDFAKKWQEEAGKKGFDLWKPEETTQTGKAGSISTMSQETGSELKGLLLSLQIHFVNIDDTVKDIVMSMYEAFDVLLRIEANTAYCKHLEQMAADIAEFKRDGLKMQ